MEAFGSMNGSIHFFLAIAIGFFTDSDKRTLDRLGQDLKGQWVEGEREQPACSDSAQSLQIDVDGRALTVRFNQARLIDSEERTSVYYRILDVAGDFLVLDGPVESEEALYPEGFVQSVQMWRLYISAEQLVWTKRGSIGHRPALKLTPCEAS